MYICNYEFRCTLKALAIVLEDYFTMHVLVIRPNNKLSANTNRRGRPIRTSNCFVFDGNIVQYFRL